GLVFFHKLCGYALIVCWVLFLIANAQGNGRHYRMQLSGWFGRMFKQVRFYLWGIMRGESHPFPADEKCKFNPIQQLAYVGVMYLMLPLLLISGLAVTYPEIFALGKQHFMFLAHQALAIISVLFMIVHIYLCTTGDTPTQTFKCMIDGNHRHLENKGAK
ncbi:MAG: thiosulfate reductase cytochrome B subunit, partial [Saezia sp.]